MWLRNMLYENWMKKKIKKREKNLIKKEKNKCEIL